MRYYPRSMHYLIRKASLDDRTAIADLIKASARHLSRADYSATQIEGAIATVFGVDTNLILDETYFVAESAGKLIGGGGWRKRRTLFFGAPESSPDAGATHPRNQTGKS